MYQIGGLLLKQCFVSISISIFSIETFKKQNKPGETIGNLKIEGFSKNFIWEFKIAPI